MKLFVVESPGKVKKIQGFLGPSYRVMASFGHVRDLPDKEMGIAPPDFVPEYVPTDRGSSILAKLRAAAKDAEEVYLATDPDREGEAIAWHIEDALKLTGARRVSYTEITEQAVKAALRNTRSIDRHLVASQECRRVLDRLVGYLVSPALSRQSGDKLSAGRVQSPAVRLVVERERAIRDFKVTAHFGVDLIFEAMEHVTDGWKASWLSKEGWLEDGQDYVLDKTMAEQVAGAQQVVVTDCLEIEAKSSPPAPFITSTLQQAASSALKFSPRESMELAQGLYEGGHITYMRTDSPNLSAEALAAIRSWAAQHDYPVPALPRTWQSKDGAQEAHEAIRPTHFEIEEAGDSEEEKALYRLIRLRAIASQLEEAVYAVRTLRLRVNQPGAKATIFDFTCPEVGLRLQEGEHLKTGTPYPNKQYLVACRNTGKKKAVSGFLVQIPRCLRKFTTTTRWKLSDGPILSHHVEHQVMDDDFDMLTEELLYWCGYGETWQTRWPESLEGIAIAAAQPRMAIVPGDGRNGMQLADRIEDGIIVERREVIQMPTVERERLFAPAALREWPIPTIKDAFTVS